MSTLQIVRAGAGSGKTTDLCQTVADAVAAGLHPARILATTFTKKAAAELKGRIQAKLLSADGVHATAHLNADRLELAAIGTVHSVAHQLLTRYAIELGLSPRLEVITEDGSDRTLRELLGMIPAERWEPLTGLAERLGVTDLHRRILLLLSAKRGNRIADEAFLTQMAKSADGVCELLAPRGIAVAEMPPDLLYDLADKALAAINALTNDIQKNTNDARQKLRRLKSGNLPLWGSYLEAVKITAGKRSGADALLDTLRLHASDVRQNPRLHADLREYCNLLASEAVRLSEHYATSKAERGLIDYTDLELLLLTLLENERLSARLAGDYDLVLVDEFQDTNPLQLAIFQRLRALVPRNRWVGDPKQAIYGFRDTDPQLVNEIWDRAPGVERTVLPNNHRSQKGLVELVGMLFQPVFGDDAQQAPKRAAMPRGVERWLFESKNQQDDALALACGIAELHSEGIRFGDIAVLERKNRLLLPLAAALDSLGIPYLLESPGLFRTREGAMLLAGLRLVADRSDALAAATVLHLLCDPSQPTPEWITERLTSIRARESEASDTDPPTYQLPWESDPRLSKIEQIDRTLLSPRLVTQAVIEALAIPDHVRKWGEAARRCSNLDSALRHARDYEQLAFSNGQAATLTGLILHLEKLEAESRDMRYTSQGHDAVTLMTYHAAKGLEWPVVVLSGLHKNRQASMWSPVVTGGARAESEPLAGRTLRSWTWPFGESDGEFGKLRGGSGLEDDALTSPEGIERTAQERSENLRLLYVGCTRARHKLVFAHRTHQYDWLKQLTSADTLLDPTLDAGEHALAGCESTFVMRRLSPDRATDYAIPKQLNSTWIAGTTSGNSSNASQRFHSPSRPVEPIVGSKFEITELPGQSFFPAKGDQKQDSALGDAVHSYLAAIPSLRSLDESLRLQVAERCLAAHKVTGVIPPSVLVSAGDRFCNWVESTYPGAVWHAEMAVSGPRAEGGQWSGTVDLVLQATDGELVIFDHKSAPIQREHCAMKATQFAAQLSAYVEILQPACSAVKATWIHFPLAGVVARMT